MISGNKQPKWDIYEAVILLDGYLEWLNTNHPKTKIIKRISADLRRMATNRGTEIDDIYRNENGISYQIQSIDSAYKGEKVYIPATRLFVEVVELYRTDTERYFGILKEAKRMVAAKQNNKEAFLAWAASVLPAQRCKWLEKNILKIEHFAIVFKLISGSIFDITDTATLTTIYKSVGKNKIFQIKNRKLIKNINDDFQTYMQYCSQLSKKADQATDSDMLVIEPSAKSLSTFATLTEQEAGTTASKHSMSANAPTSAACEAEFLAYLQNTTKLADKTCVSYVSSIRSAERYAIDNGYLSYSLFNEDKEKIIATASELYSDPDFISYNDTQTAIYNAIYKKVLSGKYHLNGKILTKEKSELDAVMLLKQYIEDKDECTFDEVADKVVELTGSINRQYAFQALYDDMVRVDKNRFVANRLVNFSIDEIDTVLAGFVTDNFCAIRDVTTFAMFPLCGQNWNHYLLESFCYKYSRRYSLHVIHFNDKNAGIIAEKNFNKKYNEMLVIALAKTDVELSPEVIGQYLFNTGYMAKSKYAKLGEIAQRASELREKR